MASVPVDRFAELCAPAHWQAVDFISDLHLQASEPATRDAWVRYLAQLRHSPADALFILGDLFEAWVGDDVLLARTGPSDAQATETGQDAEHRFLQACAQALRETTRHKPVYFMRGNRDFLFGASALKACGMQGLDDPTTLQFHGKRWLLSHGDALCLEDTEYMQFRAQVRQASWQTAFLAQPLPQREALVRDMRAQSRARKQAAPLDTDRPALWADLDTAASRAWLRHAGAQALVHGHTHRPGVHGLGDGLHRIVLSDWDAAATPPRGEVLRLDARGWHRLPLASSGGSSPAP